MKKLLFLLLILPLTIFSQAYNFDKDIEGLVPNNVVVMNGYTKVLTHPTEGKSMVATVNGIGNTAVANMSLFPSTSNYSIIWKETYTVPRRSGFILRANGSNSITSGLAQGYLFQVNSATNNVRIYRSNSSSFTLLSSINLLASESNIPRWYRATVDRNSLMLDYSSDGVNFVNLISTTDNSYAFGNTQYTIGYGGGSGNVYIDDIKFLGIPNNSIDIDNIKSYQVFQRNSVGKSDIFIKGIYKGNPTGIEAKWNDNESWTSLRLNKSEGSFSGTLKNQNQGQGTLKVRFSNDHNIVKTIKNVGIGDIYVIAGQSNASGRGRTLNSYSHKKLKASLFGNDDIWKELRDRVDSNLGQIDQVSSDGLANGSPWPLVATRIMETQNIPVAFIPAAKGGSNILQWQPGQNHFDSSTLYGSMARRIKAVGGQVKGILFHQGESDAFSNTSQEDYEKRLQNFVNNISSDFNGLKVMIAQIGHANNNRLDVIRKAQFNVINQNENTILGPATYDINLQDEDGDFLHFKSDKDMQELSRRWFLAIDKAYYSGKNGYGPVIYFDRITYNRKDNVIKIPFKDEEKPVISNQSTATIDAFDLFNNEPIKINSIRTLDSTVLIIPGISLNIEKPITLSYASLNKGVNSALYDSTDLPATNFYDLPVKVIRRIKPSFDGDNLIIFPNPASNLLNIEGKQLILNDLNTIVIKDLTGKLVKKITNINKNVNNTLILDISDINKGLYIISINFSREKRQNFQIEIINK